uniref:TDP43_N domain-containing protein n=1 Tax=Meloidogyne hapla TaxID=6305 RepID=A0A1I8BYG9_MELHA
SEVNVMLVDKRGRLVRRIMLPTDGDGNLALETLAVSFPEAIGLMYRTLPDVYHQIEYSSVPLARNVTRLPEANVKVIISEVVLNGRMTCCLVHLEHRQMNPTKNDGHFHKELQLAEIIFPNKL